MDCEPLDNCPATPESDSEVTRISAMLLSPRHEADASPVAECGSIRGDAPPTLPETVRRRRKVVYGLTPRSLPPRSAGTSLGQQRETVLGVAERREGCVRVTGTHGVLEPSEVGRADPHPRRIGRVGDALGARGGDVADRLDRSHRGLETLRVGLALEDRRDQVLDRGGHARAAVLTDGIVRSEEHTSELQTLMRISSAVFCLKKKIRH